jgi:hypothetical protein
MATALDQPLQIAAAIGMILDEQNLHGKEMRPSTQSPHT